MAYLPIDFPPKSTVWRYFDRWRHDGTLDLIHDRLRRKVRTMEKPYHPRTSASVDSQSVDTTSGGEQRGRDNFKNVDGRKAPYRGRQHGFAVGRPGHGRRRGRRPGGDQTVRPAGRPAGGQGRADVRRRQVHNFTLYEWVEANTRWELSIVRRPEGSEGWVRLPIRWTVERTFAWLGQCRRLTKDREKSVRSSEAFIKLAMIHLMLNRIEPTATDAEFHYREAA